MRVKTHRTCNNKFAKGERKTKEYRNYIFVRKVETRREGQIK